MNPSETTSQPTPEETTAAQALYQQGVDYLGPYDGYGDQPIDKILSTMEESGVIPIAEQQAAIRTGIERFLGKVASSTNDRDISARETAERQLARFVELTKE